MPGLHGKPGLVLPYIVLRCFYAKGDNEEYTKPIDKTETDLYHGGNAFTDEISALSSLFLGVRIKASSVTRTFDDLNNDSMGRPTYLYYRSEPNLSFDFKGIKIPHVTGQRNLQLLHNLDQILKLNNKEAIAFMRAARLYQESLWIAETDPNSAWLMLVASLEAVAGVWKEKKISNEDILRETNSNLINFLQKNEAETLISGIADILSNLTGSTKKFLNFCLYFLPDAPEKRPLKFQQIEWTEQSWKKILGMIYGYRSKALHEGIPFPLPMSHPPFKHTKGEAPSEKGTIGLAIRQGNTSWEAQHLPINLNLFAIVTRQILLKWLSHVATVRQ